MQVGGEQERGWSIYRSSFYLCTSFQKLLSSIRCQ
jgi:hypothetical protein